MPTPSEVAPSQVPLCVPELRGNEWQYVKECLDTNWVSSVGRFVDRFEQGIASYVGTKHAVATVSGTAALHVALQVAGVEAEDEVLVSALTFIAPANAVRYLGAWPVFIGPEPNYWQMDPDNVVRFLREECVASNGSLVNRSSGRRVRALLPVHLLGHPVDLRPILEVARHYELPVVEDATESLGALYHGTKVGHLGDIACFSFNGNKLITTGGGGMIVTDHPAFARRARHLTTQAKTDEIEYIHNEVGYNYRLTNLQAAVGCAQVERLDELIAAKRATAAHYAEELADVPGITVPREAPWALSAYWLYSILVDAGRYGEDSRTLLRRLGGLGIQTRPVWQPLHRSPAQRGTQAYRAEMADAIYERALSLPSSAGLSADERLRVVNAIRRA